MPRTKTRYYPDYGPMLPSAGPDWVWQRAEFLIANGFKASQGRDGPDIIRAMKYSRAMHHGFAGRWRRHQQRDPDIHEAVAVSNSSHVRLLEIHCRILARESIGRIAVEMGLTRPVLQTYLQTFFDVDHRLDQRGYIMSKVISVAPAHPQNAYQLAMQCAYSHGPAAIPMWIDWFGHMTETHDLSTPEGRQRETIELLILTHDLDIDPRRAARLAKWEASGVGIEPKMFRSKSPSEIMAENTSRWLKGLDFEVSPDRSKTADLAGEERCCNSVTTGESGKAKGRACETTFA